MIDGVGERVSVAVGVAVKVGLDVGVGELVFVCVSVAVNVGVEVGVGVPQTGA